jgi:hypothetical protein
MHTDAVQPCNTYHNIDYNIHYIYHICKSTITKVSGNIKAALHKLQYSEPACPEHAPRVWNHPVYGARNQFVEEQNDSPLLPPKDVTLL